jgi:peptidylprolyl isomerase
MTRSLIPLAAIIALSSCGQPKPAGPATIETTSFARSLGVDLSAMTKTPSGLYYRDLAVGNGPVVAAGNTVSVHYSGALPNGQGFDQNGPSDPPFVFQAGAKGVIDGWDEGVVGMRVGGRRQLVIPPALGYGAAGNGPIPPNAILVFTVEVVGVQ